MGLLQALENSALAQWLSVSMLGAPTLIAIHSAGMAAAVGLALVVALSLNGRLAALSARQLERLLDIALAGFGVNLASGLGIFVTRASEYVMSTVFLTKMLLVVLSFVTSLALRHRIRCAAPAGEAFDADFQARALSVVSAGLWFAAVIAGRLIAYLSDLYR